MIVLIPFLGMASTGTGNQFEADATLKTFLTPNAYNNAQSIESFQHFIAKLERKRTALKSDREFLKYVFYKTHQRFLKNYTSHATLDNTFANGNYNCLSGTILYALILNQFNIPHEVIETNYHIFILAETPEGKILMEATDPLNGFVTNHEELDMRIAVYKQNELNNATSRADKSHYKFRFDLYNSVSLNELRGLSYYNMAVFTFNNQQLPEAVEYLMKALALYSSPRMDEFSQLVLLALQASELAPKTKENCMRAILLFQQQSVTVAVN
jgi:hypothetical protein